MPEKNGQELAALPPSSAPPPAALNPFADVFGSGPDGVVSSFKLNSTEGRYLAQKCAEVPDESLRELVNGKIAIEHIYAHRIDLPHPETGELVPCLRTCLITTEGRVHACVSDGVRQSVGRLIAGHGLPPWKPALVVTVKQKPTKNGRVRMFLWDESASEPKGGKK
jgi:Phage Single-stranded DNA-binding protein